MRILQINASYKPAYIYGGPTMSVSKLSEEMVEAGCSIEVFTTTANGTEELPIPPNTSTIVDGVRVTYFKRLTKDHTHFSPALLRRLSNEVKNFDIVHIHAWWNLVSVLSCRIAIKSGVPVVISPRGTLSAYSFSNRNNLSKKLIHNLLGKQLLKKSFIHVTSDREEKAMEALINSRGLFNIPNFIKLPEKIQYETQLPNDTLKMIFLSRIEKKKGLEILFDALAGINIPYQLTIAGDGEPSYINELKALAAKNNIEKHLDWIGFRREDKFDILQQHHLMVLPSYDENFGNVVIESLSMGTAVLLSEHVGLSKYVEENNFGWVCKNDAVAFNKMIRLIAGERKKMIETREKAPLKIRQDLNEENLRLRYMDMYRQIIEHD